MAKKSNLLCFGDNLKFLRDKSIFPDESVDLEYLDPPFNSQRGYNVLFKEMDGTSSVSQIQAFDDTWTWDRDAAERYAELQQTAAPNVVAVMGALQIMVGYSPMFAYLVQMAVRLVELHRILKKTGSLYLHCDPTASHYLKLILDSIFGIRSYKNEIIWKRTNVHSDSKTWSHVSDTIFFYTKSEQFTWNPIYLPHSNEHIESKYSMKEPDGRAFTLSDMTSPNPRPNMVYEWKGHAPPPNGWRYSKETMERLECEGRIWYPNDKGKRPRLKRYLTEMPGTLITNVWTDINPLNSQAQERLGYPTQKPMILLKRIISASSNPGDTILDPFCGCGTTIAAVEAINREKPEEKKRKWIGIDITYLAVTLIKNRLGSFENPKAKFEVIGEPADVESAKYLAQKDRDEFQYWASGLVGARPWTGKPKKGADKGIDGVRFFSDTGDGKLKTVLVQVKSGHVSSRDIRDLYGTVQRENAAIGIFITLEKTLREIYKEAATAGHYFSQGAVKNFPRIQVLTIDELLADPDGAPNPRCLQLPPSVAADTFKQAKRVETDQASATDLFTGD